MNADEVLLFFRNNEEYPLFVNNTILLDDGKYTKEIIYESNKIKVELIIENNKIVKYDTQFLDL